MRTMMVTTEMDAGVVAGRYQELTCRTLNARELFRVLGDGSAVEWRIKGSADEWVELDVDVRPLDIDTVNNEYRVADHV